MSATMEIRPARAVDCDDLVATLGRHGLDCERVEGGAQPTLAVSGAGEDAEVRDEIVRALEEWVAGHRLPFVPIALDERSYALGPPAG